MKKQDRKALYKQALAQTGSQFQLLKIMEECGELTQAICKYINNPCRETLLHLIEETVDVRISTEQVKQMFWAWSYDYNEIQTEKLNRLQNRLKKSNETGRKQVTANVRDIVSIQIPETKKKVVGNS